MRHLTSYKLFESTSEQHKVFIDKPELDELLYGQPSKDDVAKINSYMNKIQHKYDEDVIRLYHGTASKFKQDILDNGLTPTTNSNKHSLQSTPGYVYLSVYPEMARKFGELGYAGKDITVFQIELYVRDVHLLPDLDQLGNVRMWSDNKTIGTTIGESILYGHALRYKGKVPPYSIRVHE